MEFIVSKYQHIYRFNPQIVDGNGRMKDLLGGKGAGLAEMTRCGLPVPPGFTVTTEACKLFNKNPKDYASMVLPQFREAVHELESVSGKRFGKDSQPLLVSVRSGARFSMPGMMDTVLNIGLNDRTVVSLTREMKDDAAAWDCYRRLLQMFGGVVLGLPEEPFKEILEEKKLRKGVHNEIDLGREGLGELVQEFKDLIRSEGRSFPQDPWAQLSQAAEAVFRSWNNPRAVTYRRLHEISEDLGTAVNVQMMVYGNLEDNSGSGVGFTRDPATGERKLYGEYLPRVQGEEVVAGTRTPLALEQLQQSWPHIYCELEEISEKLERLYRDMQDFEFTVENGKLYMLQTRDGKRTGLSAVRVAVDMVNENLISLREALMRVSPEQLEQLLHPVLDAGDKEVLAQGLPASPGAAVGRVVFSSRDAVERARRGERVILVRSETMPDDIHGMEVAEGILTARGGMTSHAAVVARGMGKCCVVGCEEVEIDVRRGELRLGGKVVQEGDFLSVSGNDGRVYEGRAGKGEVKTLGVFSDFMELLAEVPTLAVRANADTPRDARKAREFGAVGIGLCRTEHMFFGSDRLKAMQEMILAEDEPQRRQALEKLRPFQKEDFRRILEVMDGLPVTVRLLDPPLHEFLPHREEIRAQIERLEKQQEATQQLLRNERILERIDQLKEVNPMLGHRGCRLGISYPEITEMQARALFEAACELKNEGRSPVLEVMVPLVGFPEEFQNQQAVIHTVAEEVFASQQVRVSYLVGTMLELPRAALVAHRLAQDCQFFSFGTNDLTQTTLGFSRDDAAKFIQVYRDRGILPRDPFQSLDREGVGQLMRLAVEKGKAERADLKVGICGEHGGDPNSIQFCYEIDLDYVSCSPYRVPVARLAAAQAALRSRDELQPERVGG